MPPIIQKIIIAYAFFIFGMMAGFGYLNGAQFMVNSIFELRDYQALFLSALIALFIMGLMQRKK